LLHFGSRRRLHSLWHWKSLGRQFFVRMGILSVSWFCSVMSWIYCEFSNCHGMIALPTVFVNLCWVPEKKTYVLYSQLFVLLFISVLNLLHSQLLDWLLLGLLSCCDFYSARFQSSASSWVHDLLCMFLEHSIVWF
jgi:hypothetical protein